MLYAARHEAARNRARANAESLAAYLNAHTPWRNSAATPHEAARERRRALTAWGEHHPDIVAIVDPNDGPTSASKLTKGMRHLVIATAIVAFAGTAVRSCADVPTPASGTDPTLSAPVR